jgi:hypothetical protein
MFNSRTLFVLGAGASKEVGLPTGKELTKIIAKKLSIPPPGDEGGDKAIYLALRAHAGDQLEAYLETANLVSQGMQIARSIDSHIDAHRGDEKVELCGKLAIVRSIMEAEHGSILFKTPDKRAPHSSWSESVQQTWFVEFFKMLYEGVAKSEISSLFENVSFINFNYDRCLEYFIVEAIRIAYGATQDEAENLAKRLKVMHPYGTVGPLPWQGEAAIPFGQVTDDAETLLALSKNIRTYTEKVEEGDSVADIRREVARAHVIVFLGFAFHDMNMALLSPPETINDTVRQRIYATAFDFSPFDASRLQITLKNMLRLCVIRQVAIGSSCFALFKSNQYGISHE